jgi:hypothetical protein
MLQIKQAANIQPPVSFPIEYNQAIAKAFNSRTSADKHYKLQFGTQKNLAHY